MDPRGRTAVPVWRDIINPARTRAAARPHRSHPGRDRRPLAVSRRWRPRARSRAEHRAKPHTRPATRPVLRPPRAIAARGSELGSVATAAAAPAGCWLDVGDSAPGARRRSRRARSGAGDRDAGISSRNDIPRRSCGLPRRLLFVLGQVPHVQLARTFEPVLVGLDRQRPHQPQAVLGIGEDPHHMGAAFDLFV